MTRAIIAQLRPRPTSNLFHQSWWQSLNLYPNWICRRLYHFLASRRACLFAGAAKRPLRREFALLCPPGHPPRPPTTTPWPNLIIGLSSRSRLSRSLPSFCPENGREQLSRFLSLRRDFRPVSINWLYMHRSCFMKRAHRLSRKSSINKSWIRSIC